MAPSHPLLEIASSPAGAIPLTALPPGRRGVIAAVEPGSGIGRRLLDLGFVPGTEIRVVRRAPLGDPVSYELRGMRIGLRHSEAARIAVHPLPDEMQP